MSSEPATEHPGAESATATADDTAEVINSRYRIVERLGSGGMGAVFLALDRHRGDRKVALKRVRGDRADASILATLRNEFLSLASFRHPNVAQVYDFGLDLATKDIFFTSELVSGPSLAKTVADLRLETEEDLRSFLGLAVQVLRGLEFIHSRGIIHLDIKPENILVGDAAPDEAAEPCPKLIDFGLARKEKGFGGRKIMGTTYYIAPETILGARMDRRTDLYSFGIVLYHLATGQLPFRGKGNLEIFKGHLEQSPVPPHEAVPGIPRQLSTIILCLVEKKPDDRFQSALEVIDEINRELGCSFPLETDETLSSYLDSARTAGREDEIEKLHAIFGQVSKTVPLGIEAEGDTNTLEIERGLLAGRDIAPPTVPSGRLVLLRGEKGLGKRRLLETLGYLAQTRGAAVLQVECGTGAGEPGSDFLELVQEVAGYGGQDEESASFAETALALARDLKNRGSDPEPDEGMTEALRTLSRGLIERSREHPFLLHFHEIHRAGRILCEAVRCLVEAGANERSLNARHLLTASTLDQADIEESPLNMLYLSPSFRHSILEMRLERLDTENVGRLVRTAFDGCDFSERLAADLVEESDGNPEIVIDILGFLLRQGTIRRTPLGWALKPGHGRKGIPGKVRSALKERIASLPEPARRLATAFAVLGEASPLEVAARLSGIPEKAVEDSLLLLRKEKLLQERFIGDPERVFSFVHSTARDLLYRDIPEDERADYHNRAGEIYEDHSHARRKADPRQLAYHFLRAANREKGISYGVEAAEAYARENAPLRAIATYEEVLGLLPPADYELSLSLRRKVAELRFLIGNYRESAAILGPLRERAELAQDSDSRSRVYLATARAHGRLGDYRTAATLTKEVVRWQREEGPSPVLGELLLLCAELHGAKGNIVESLRCCDRLLDLRGKVTEPDVLGRLYLVLAENHFRLNNQRMAATYCQEALKLIDARQQEGFPDFNLFCLAKYYKYSGKLLKAAKQFELSAQVSRKLGASERRADALLEMGVIHEWLERPRVALPALEQAHDLYSRSGNVPFTIETLCALGETRRLVGEYEEARKCLGEAFRMAEEVDNPQAKTRALLSYAGLCLDGGDLENAERYLEEADSKDVRVSGYVAQKMLELRFTLATHRGEIGDALDHAAKVLVSGSQGEDRIASAKLLAQRAMLLCRLGKRIDARRAVVMLLEIGKSYSFPLSEGRARLLEGMVLAAEHKSRLAEKSFAQAEEIFRREGCERELIQVYLEHGLLSLKAGKFENTYLNLEEGFYLAKKLNIAHMKCRYYFAMGLLELAIPEGDPARAEERLRYAERLAAQVPYRELQWQIQYYLGKLYDWKGEQSLAEEYFARSLAGRRTTTDSIPLTYRQGYLRAAADEELEKVLDEQLASRTGAAQEG